MPHAFFEGGYVACRRFFTVTRSCLTLLLLLYSAAALSFDVPSAEHGQQSRLTRSIEAPELQVQAEQTSPLSMSAGSALQRGASAFATRHGGQWETRWDLRSDRPNIIQGSGVALVPGRGNPLTSSSIGLRANSAVELATVEHELRRFIAANDDLLRTQDMEFRLDPASSVPAGDGNTHWFIEFAQYHEGVRVDRAQLFFRISHGNIVQFGEELVAPVTIDTTPAFSREQAFAAAWQQIQFVPDTHLAEILEAGELLLLPVSAEADAPGTSYRGVPGVGYAHRLAWRFVFRVQDDPATYEVLFDAHAGQLMEVRNLTVYADASVTGGVYPTTNTEPEISVPMPFAAVSNGSSKVTDALGIYNYSGGSASTSLDGKYFRMSDNCGSISLSDSTSGNLDFGSSGGTDCVTPGVGGAGNTHASRTGFYHLTNINRKAATYLTSTSWLNSKVTANMNVNDVCNAFWNGSTVNFFKSGYSDTTFCSNTGELAAVFLHEWGHGLDTNTGGAANEQGSGEAVGDTFAFLETRDACIGSNFRPGMVCKNCTTCTGVRDVSDFSLSGTRRISRPSNVTGPGGIACDTYIGSGGIACPFTHPSSFQAYRGPMGYEGHCESYIASSANWDLTQSLVAEFGAEEGWQSMDRIWYRSLTPSKSAYRVASGGQCNANAQVDGCGTNNWYTVMLVADDDNGNLTDGTPNACRIWDAFDAHGIACGTRPVCTSSGEPDFTLSVPVVSQTTCAPSSASFALNIGSRLDFDSPVSLSTGALPAGLTASFSPNPVSPGQTAQLQLATTAAAAGRHDIDILASAAGSAGHTATVSLDVSAAVPGNTMLLSPLDGAIDTALQPPLSWQEVPDAGSYTLEIATDPGFSTLVASYPGLTATSHVPNGLNPATTYYWRVIAINGCGMGQASMVFHLTTGIPFPQPYCPVTFPSGVEPITLVKFSLIDNRSATSGGPAHEDFLGVAGGLVEAGEQYQMAVEGNTVGSYTTRVNAYIDWNRSGTFDSSESYSIGNITNSTGVDGKRAIATITVPTATTPGPVRMRVIKKYNAEAPACNSAGYGQAEDYTLVVNDSGVSYTVGGTVSGLAGMGLRLALNGTGILPIGANGVFTFSQSFGEGDSYVVSVLDQPANPVQSCTVSNGSGVIGSSDVDNIAVSCATPAHQVGGTVSGLSGVGLRLALNGAEILPINANGVFTFAQILHEGDSYAVSVLDQPSNPNQRCTLSNGSGVIGTADVTTVQVSCTTPTYRVGGVVSGLSGTGLTLGLNTLDLLPLSANGQFSFDLELSEGATYAVDVAVQPTQPLQWCDIVGGSGVIATADVDSIQVHCGLHPDDVIFIDGFESYVAPR